MCRFLKEDAAQQLWQSTVRVSYKAIFRDSINDARLCTVQRYSGKPRAETRRRLSEPGPGAVLVDATTVQCSGELEGRISWR